MGRYNNFIKSHKGIEEVNSIVNSYLSSEGFRLVKTHVIEYDKVQVWRRGGFISNPQNIKISVTEDEIGSFIHIEAWLNTLGFPIISDAEINPMTRFSTALNNRNFSIRLAMSKLQERVIKLEMALK